MSKKRRAFSVEYKREAVKLVTEQGYSIAQACACLGVGETAMHRWLTQVESGSKGYVCLARSRFRQSCSVFVSWRRRSKSLN